MSSSARAKSQWKCARLREYDFHRIGYGGGFYDRYLSEDNTFIKAALAFDFQLLESIPYEEHDLKPDYIITQTQFIRREN